MADDIKQTETKQPAKAVSYEDKCEAAVLQYLSTQEAIKKHGIKVAPDLKHKWEILSLAHNEDEDLVIAHVESAMHSFKVTIPAPAK